jgi:hypothetical protein
LVLAYCRQFIYLNFAYFCLFQLIFAYFSAHVSLLCCWQPKPQSTLTKQAEREAYGTLNQFRNIQSLRMKRYVGQARANGRTQLVYVVCDFFVSLKAGDFLLVL